MIEAKINMDAERILSATVATAKSINKAIKTIDATNNTKSNHPFRNSKPRETINTTEPDLQ
jgi:hypothetical protein